MAPAWRGWWTILALLAATGCGTTKLSNTPRTATEQLLLTNAWDSALAQVDFSPLAGVAVHLDATQIEALDKGWVVSSVKEAMLRHGALLKTKPEEAVWVCEARVGALGTNSSDWLVGVPAMNVPAVVPGVPSGAISEIPVLKKSKQQGVAKLAFFAYDRATGALRWTSGPRLASADSKLLNVGPIGPIKNGSLYDGAQLDDLRLPGANVPPPMTLPGNAEFLLPAPRKTPAMPPFPPLVLPDKPMPDLVPMPTKE